MLSRLAPPVAAPSARDTRSLQRHCLVTRAPGAGRTRVVVTTAAASPGGVPPRRGLLLAVLGLAVAVPVAKELVQDLGRGLDEDANVYAPLPQPGPGQAVATFAGGCFWCMEAPFDILDGVLATTSGYTGGTVARPSYLQVGSGMTGHLEAVQVLYDPARVTYDQLLAAFWRSCDPTDPDGQFVDRGDEYRTAIFYHTDEQRAAAEASRDRLQASGVFGPGARIVTEIRPASDFWPAENYHQDYYSKKNRYQFYRSVSGRDTFLERTWGTQFVRTEQAAALKSAAALAARRAGKSESG